MSGTEYHLTIKSLPEEIRPRERMREVGPGALSSAELLAITLGSGSREESALDLAQRLLQGSRGLRFLAEASFEELCGVKGIGPAKAAQVQAAVELGKRLACMEQGLRPTVRSPQDVCSFVMEEMCYLDREHFRVVILNTKNQVLAVETISVGSLNSSLVHPREVFKPALLKSAAAVILLHNHPSGDATPSSEDLEITRRLVEAGKLIGIEVLDHIIIGDHVFTSLKEKAVI
ncbi:MAG: DNA repair protein RadC [Thermacetogeniaceae bacterium]